MSTTLTYNGILLDVVETEDYLKEAVYEGEADYLYTRHTIKVRAIYNPGRVSYKDKAPQGQVSFNPTIRTEDTAARGIGATPSLEWKAPQTDVAVRHRLMTPRGQLVFENGGIRILKVGQDSNNEPYGRKYLDSKNGPFPLECDVEEIIGTRTFKVSFTVQAHVNECDRYTSPLTPWVSHRWDVSHAISEDFYTTKTIHGKVVFDTKTLQSLEGGGIQSLADFYRPELFNFHPVPLNFQRKGVAVHALPDRTGLEYEIVDEEQGMNILARNNVTRIEATYSEGMSSAGSAAAIAGAGEAIVAFSVARGLTRSSRRERPGGPTGSRDRNRGGIRAALGTAAVGATGAIYGALRRGGIPLVDQAIDIKVYGNRFATRQNLETIAWMIVAYRFPRLRGAIDTLANARDRARADERTWWGQVSRDLRQFFAQVGGALGIPLDDVTNFLESLSGFSWTVTEDLMEKTVSLVGKRTAAIPESVFNFFANQNPARICRPSDSIQNVTTTADAINPTLTNNARGTYEGLLVPAELGVPCTIKTNPPIPNPDPVRPPPKIPRRPISPLPELLIPLDSTQQQIQDGRQGQLDNLIPELDP